jgi:hypothetical protein
MAQDNQPSTVRTWLFGLAGVLLPVAPAVYTAYYAGGLWKGVGGNGTYYDPDTSQFHSAVEEIKEKYGTEALNKQFAFLDPDGKSIEFYTLDHIQKMVKEGRVDGLSRILINNGKPPYNNTDTGFVSGFKSQSGLSDSDVYRLGNMAAGNINSYNVATDYSQGTYFLCKNSDGSLYAKKVADMNDTDYSNLVGSDLNSVPLEDVNATILWQQKNFAGYQSIMKYIKTKYADDLKLSTNGVQDLDKKSLYDILSTDPDGTVTTLTKYNEYFVKIFNPPSGNPLLSIKSTSDFLKLCNRLNFQNDITTTFSLDPADPNIAIFKDSLGGAIGKIKMNPSTGKVEGLGTAYSSNNGYGFQAKNIVNNASTIVKTNPTAILNNAYNPTYVQYTPLISLPSKAIDDTTNYGLLPDGTCGIRIPKNSTNIVSLNDIMNRKNIPVGEDYDLLISRLFNGPNSLVKIDSYNKLQKFRQFLCEKNGVNSSFIDSSDKPIDTTTIKDYSTIRGIKFTNEYGQTCGKLDITTSGTSPNITYQFDGLGNKYNAADTKSTGFKFADKRDLSPISTDKLTKLNSTTDLAKFVNDPVKIPQNMYICIIALVVAAILSAVLIISTVGSYKKNKDIENINGATDIQAIGDSVTKSRLATILGADNTDTVVRTSESMKKAVNAQSSLTYGLL